MNVAFVTMVKINSRFFSPKRQFFFSETDKFCEKGFKPRTENKKLIYNLTINNKRYGYG